MTKLIHLPADKAKKVMAYYERHIQQYLDAEDALRANEDLDDRRCYMCDAAVGRCSACPISGGNERQKFPCMNFKLKGSTRSIYSDWETERGALFILATIPEIRAKRDHILSQIEKYVRLNGRVVYVWIPKEYTK